MDAQRIEALGPAEKIVQTLLTHADHLVHNRPGFVVRDPGAVGGVQWQPATHVVEDGEKIAYKLVRAKNKKQEKVRLGAIGADGKIRAEDRVVGEYREAGLFPEVAAWMYRQVADVYRMDAEFAARWASFAFPGEHRDLKVVLAAFLLVQPRSGEAIRENGQILFHDDDFRDVGEAMMLIRRGDGKDLNPKLLLRIGELLSLREIAAINRELGFGKSGRNPALGRWPKAVEKWLAHRERNPKMLEGLVKAGFRTTVMALARRVHYKPETDAFFKILRWKQVQSKDGRRSLAIGEAVEAGESWAGLSEAEICERIVAGKPNFKRIVGLLPEGTGLTRAIAAAAIEAGSLSAQDLIILTPTLEDLGLLDVAEVKARWQEAVNAAENQRAANIAQRVKKTETATALQDAADNAVKKAVAEVVRGLRVYVMVDISGSMQGAIDRAKVCLSQFLQGFPLEKTHVAVFNTAGREVAIRHASAAGVTHAFAGFSAGGGTDYGSGVRALQAHKPELGEDALFLFVGDQEAPEFSEAVKTSGLGPTAFGFLDVKNAARRPGVDAVEKTADALQIPCFRFDERLFDDPYAVTRVLRSLIAATPVGARPAPRVTLVQQILSTELLKKPVWAS